MAALGERMGVTTEQDNGAREGLKVSRTPVLRGPAVGPRRAGARRVPTTSRVS